MHFISVRGLFLPICGGDLDHHLRHRHAGGVPRARGRRLQRRHREVRVGHRHPRRHRHGLRRLLHPRVHHQIRLRAQKGQIRCSSECIHSYSGSA